MNYSKEGLGGTLSSASELNVEVLKFEARKGFQVRIWVILLLVVNKRDQSSSVFLQVQYDSLDPSEIQNHDRQMAPFDSEYRLSNFLNRLLLFLIFENVKISKCWNKNFVF